jgi:Fe-S-cluster containining protein
MHNNHQIRIVRNNAYKGVTGARRKDSALKYREYFGQLVAQERMILSSHLNDQHLTISCKKECDYCCYQYISISQLEGIAIVDFLYDKSELIPHFIDNYKLWFRTAEEITKKIDELMWAFSESGNNSLLWATLPLYQTYFTIQVACPFLVERNCIIYPIRPMVCALHYSSSLPAHCSIDSTLSPQIFDIPLKESDLNVIANISPFGLFRKRFTLPSLIYLLLTKGT